MTSLSNLLRYAPLKSDSGFPGARLQIFGIWGFW